MSVKLLTEHHLEFLSLKGGCIGSSESILVKMPHCWKSHVVAHFMISFVALANAVLVGILHITIITSFANSRIYKPRVIFVVRIQTVLIQI